MFFGVAYRFLVLYNELSRHLLYGIQSWPGEVTGLGDAQMPSVVTLSACSEASLAIQTSPTEQGFRCV